MIVSFPFLFPSLLVGQIWIRQKSLDFRLWKEKYPQKVRWWRPFRSWKAKERSVCWISSMTVTGLQCDRRSLCRCPRKVLEKVIWLNGKPKNIRWPCVLSEKLFRTSSYHLNSVLYPDIYVHAISVQVLRCREIYVCIRRDDSLYIFLPRSFLYQIYSL